MGNFWTTGDIYRLIESSIAETLARSGTPADRVDYVVVSSSHFYDTFARRNRGLAAVLGNNGIAPRNLLAVTGTGCADVLRSIELARNLLELDEAHTVLLIGMEAFPDQQPASRLLDYALISDAAVTFLMTSVPPDHDSRDSLRVNAIKSMAMLPQVGSGMKIHTGNQYSSAVQAALEAAAIRATEVTRIFGNNTFMPVKIYRETTAGFSRQQMYLDNVERVGHCLACDPVLNLADFLQSGNLGHYLLAAEAEGHASAVLLSK